MATERYTLFTNADLKRLLVPLLVEQVLFMTVGAADTVMVASLGEVSVSAVSLVNMFNGFIASILFALATGGAVVASQALGAGNQKRACASAKQLLALSFCITCSLLLVCQLFYRQILWLIYGKLEADVLKDAITYFRITTCGYPLLSIYGCCAALCRSMNKAKVTMYISMMSNCVNVIGNALLIYWVKMGVSGAAYATFFSRICQVVVILIVMTNKNNSIYLDFREKFHFSLEMAKRILFIGIPNGIENGVFQLGRLLVVGLIAKYGTQEIAANAVANTIDYFNCIVGSAFGLAMITVVGQSVGAGIKEQVKYYVKKMMNWCYLWHIVWTLVLFAMTPFLLKLFHKVTPETIKMAFILIIIHNGMGLFLWPAAFVFPNVLRAANDVRVTMLISIGSMFLVRVGLSYVMAPLLHSGVIAVWIAMILDWVVRIVGFVLRYRHEHWVKLAGVK